MIKTNWSRGGNKYNAIPTTVDGIRFDSKKEARYYGEIKLKIKAGIISYVLFQVPIKLPGGVTYRVDFQEFHADGTVHYVDVKGRRTPIYILKKKQVEALYPIEIEEV